MREDFYVKALTDSSNGILETRLKVCNANFCLDVSIVTKFAHLIAYTKPTLVLIGFRHTS